MLNELIKIIKSVLPDSKIDFTKVNFQSRIFEDICPDSSALLMVTFAIEDHFKIELPDFLQIRKATVQDIINIIEKHEK
ncbi:MAG: acyl carrier protein [Mycoplasmataceae bacterium]|jgi:acyl carrier protein|nr:acyl carrier protein [Mycoplasmataceae bacterium]